MPRSKATTTNDIENFLRQVITELQPDSPNNTRGRPRILPALALWSGLLVCITKGMTTQLELWRLLSVKGLWDFPLFNITDQAVYNRLSQAASSTIQTVFEQVTMLLSLRLNDLSSLTSNQSPIFATFTSGVFSLDGMTLDRILKRLPSLRSEQGTVLGGKLSAIFDVQKQLWRSIQYHSNAQQNDKLEVREVIQGLPVGSLLLFDLGFFSFSWFDHLTTLQYWFVTRLRQKTSFDVIETLYDHYGVKDRIVFLGTYRADRAAHAVRLVEVFHEGVSRCYITNVLNPKVLSVLQILELYARRWDIEMMFNLVKTHLKLHFLMSSKANVMLHQVFAVFTIAQVILGLRSELAVRAKVDVFEVSLSLFVRWVIRIAADGVDPIEVLVERGRLGGIIRPSSRNTIVVPEIVEELYRDLSSNLILERKARYAGKT
jgi:Transposase DDE domain